MSATTYNGKVCVKHPELEGSRYSSSSKCVQCCKNRDRVKYEANREVHNIKTRAYYEKNKEKCLAQQKEYAAKNSEKYKAYSKKYVADNHEKITMYKKEWHEANADRIKEYRATGFAEYRKNNRDRIAASNKAWQKRNPESCNAILAARRAKKLQATPAWANDFFIEETYRLAKLREKVCGGKWHVDHIVPLKSKLVCGLHWEQNLQVIPAFMNQSKSNKHWPDMPGQTTNNFTPMRGA